MSDIRAYKKSEHYFEGELFYVCDDSYHYEFFVKGEKIRDITVKGPCTGKCGSESYPLPPKYTHEKSTKGEKRS